MRFTTLICLAAALCLVEAGRVSAKDSTFSAVISADGSLFRGNEVEKSQRNGVGKYDVTFEQNIEACTLIAGIVGALGGQTSLRLVNPRVVRVLTLDKSGAQADSPFNLIGSCPPGELVINEVMAHPAGPAGTEAQREWFELLNPTSHEVSLSGLSVNNGSVSQPITCDAAVLPHAFALFAKSADPASNDGLPTVDCLFSLNLTNSGGRLIIKRGTVVIDRVDFTGTKFTLGRAFGLAPFLEVQDTVNNDNLENWCAPNYPPYSDSNVGTPRAANVNSAC